MPLEAYPLRTGRRVGCWRRRNHGDIGSKVAKSQCCGPVDEDVEHVLQLDEVDPVRQVWWPMFQRELGLSGEKDLFHRQAVKRKLMPLGCSKLRQSLSRRICAHRPAPE